VAGEQDNMTKTYSLKIKAIIFATTLSVALISIYSISILKNSPYLTMRYVKMQWDYLGLKTKLSSAQIESSTAKATSIPVIMYFGINDKLNSDSVTQKNFKNQMHILKNEGWQTVTLSQLERFISGNEKLPQKSFLLAFEDGRKDSYYAADPILHALDFNAVMYIVTSASLKDFNTFNLDKHELKMMERSGRWDVQSHGKFAHSQITVDEIGTEADFYNNKKWLSNLNRLETDGEFIIRISDDLQLAKSDLESTLNKTVTSLSFPYNGGEVPSNYVKAEEVILSVSEKIYPYIMYQYWPRMRDGFSGNYYGDEDNKIKRININNSWDENQFLSALQVSAGQELPYLEDYNSNSKKWVPLSGDLVYTSNTLEIIPNEGEASAYLDGSKSWEDYSFRANLWSGYTGNTLSMLVHFKDYKNYTACEFKSDGVTIKSVVDGESRVLSSIKVGTNYQYGYNSKFAVDVNPTTVKCKIDNRQLLVAQVSGDEGYGGVGIKSWNFDDNQEKLAFTDINIVSNTEDEDTYFATDPGKEIIYTYLDKGKLELADQMRNDIYTVDRYASVTLKNIYWTENPYNEQYWRFMFYSLQPTKNLLTVWEKTGNDDYLIKLKEILNSYLDKGQYGPYAWDLHGSAFRTMVLVNTYKKLERQGVLGDSLKEKIERSLIRHGDFLYQEKNYEGSYNHGIDQSLAMYVLALNFPELDKNNSWANKSISRIIKGLDVIVDQNGVLIENSPYYHFYTLDKYWHLYRYLNKNNLTLGDLNDVHLENKIKKMIEYGTYILQPDSNIPLIGASLAGTVENKGVYAEMGEFDPRFLYAITQGKEGERPAHNSIIFPTAGQTIIRSGWGEDSFKDQSQVVFDGGSYRTNHSDLDALSFTLFGKGIALLPDSGLYTYEAGPYREYFHGTRGHNTVVVDGKSQQSGEYLGDDVSKSFIVNSDMGAINSGVVSQVARHTLYPGVTHNRGLVILEGKTMIVIDRLFSEDNHNYEQMFHVFPGAKLDINEDVVVAKSHNTPMMTIRQLKPGNITLSTKIGSKDPVDGLCSTKYEEAVPCHSLAYLQSGRVVEYITAITIGADDNINYELSSGKLIVDIGKKAYTINLSAESEISRDILVDKHKTEVLSGDLIDNFTIISDWTEDSNTNEVIGVVEDKKQEDPYMQLSLPEDGSLVEIKRNLKVDMTNDRLILDINIENWSEGKQMEIQLSNNSWKNFATFNFKSDIYPYTFDGEWVRVNLSAGEQRETDLGNWYFSKDVFDWSQVDGIRFRFKSYGEQAVTIKLKNLEIKPLQDEPKLVMIFDDGWSSVLDTIDIMNKYELKGNVGVISSNVGKKQYLSVSDLKLLQNTYGWNVLNHSSLHKAAVPNYYETNNLPGLAQDVSDGIYFLEKNGINSASNWYVYPNGSSNKSVEKVISDYYVYARSTLNAPEVYPFTNPYGVKVFSVYSDRADTQDTVNVINDALKYNQSLFLMFHKFSENNPDVYTEFSVADFEDIISHIAQTGIKVYTLEEYDKSHGVAQSKITIKERVPEKLKINVISK
jgi:peptidoglycan/xylan/chitin deacetylase (PgdA/CDA1 family)